jgi:2-(1,2-epoxy-1,2-dihydrophenyl)acetyl-CoA isomerase
MADQSFETITWTRTGPTATLTLNRPEQRNSITGQMMGELYDALAAAAKDDSLRVLVIRGAGRDFCPGADVKAYNQGKGGRETSLEDFNVTVMLHEMPAVTIAAIKGACAGAGMGWAMACDFRFADASARFNTAFLNVGVAGDMGMPWTLPRLVGAAKARELFMLGEKFDGAAALDLGLVTRLFGEDTYEAELAAIVDRLAAAAPLALTALKGNFVQAEKVGFADYIRFEAERHGKLFASRDTKEAFAAYVEKRKPVFEGR